MTATTIERVVVSIEALTKGYTDSMNKVITQTKAFENSMKRMRAMHFKSLNKMIDHTKALTNSIGQSANSLRNWASMQRPEFKNMNAELMKWTDTISDAGWAAMSFGTKIRIRLSSAMDKLRMKVEKTKQSMKGLTMQMLSTMFFGMLLQGVFMGLMSPVMQAFGVFELINRTLLSLFAPIMTDLMPLLINFSSWFIGLPEPVKKALGGIVLFIGGLGTVLFYLGALGLGMKGLLEWPILWTAVKKGIGPLITKLGDFWISLKDGSAWTSIKDAASGAWTAIKNGITGEGGLIAKLGDFWISLKKDLSWTSIKLKANSAWETIKNSASAAATSIKLSFETLKTNIAAIGWKDLGLAIASSIILGFTGFFAGELLKTWAEENFGPAGREMAKSWLAAGALAFGLAAITIAPFNLLAAGIVGAASAGLAVSAAALAEGGIVTRPTLATIGEAGPEAVIPLNKLGPMSIGGGNTYITHIHNPVLKDDMDVDRMARRLEERWGDKFGGPR